MIREVLSSALGRAIREELVPNNVAQLPTEQRARRRASIAAQAHTFLQAAEGDPAHPFFMLAVVYGMRRGEISALRFEDVDFESGQLSVTLVRAGGTPAMRGERPSSEVRVAPPRAQA